MFDKLKQAMNLAPSRYTASDAAKSLFAEICNEAMQAQGASYDKFKLSPLASWKTLKASPDAVQIDVAVLAVQERVTTVRGLPTRSQFKLRLNELHTAIASQLLRTRLPFRAEHVVDIAYSASRSDSLNWGFPTLSVLGLIERFCQDHPPDDELRRALKAFRSSAKTGSFWHEPTQAAQKMINRIDAILSPSADPAGFSLPPGEWQKTTQPWVDELPPRDRANWNRLFEHATTAADKSAPSKKWLADMEPLVEAVGRPEVLAKTREFLEATTPDPAHLDQSLDTLKGLIWAGSLLDHDEVAFAIGRFADVCFRKVPQIGMRSQKLGGACVSTLARMAPSGAAVSELVRLRQKVNYPSIRDQIERRLNEVSEREGLSLEELEQQSLPHFGLDENGEARTEFTDVAAILSLDEGDVVVRWIGADGKPRKTVPASAKQDAFKDQLKDLKRTVKDLKTALAGQVSYLESSYVQDSTWTGPIWAERFLQHPVRRNLADRLIWQIDGNGQQQSAMLQEGVLTSLDATPIELDETTVVRLWHPLMSDADDVLAWRRHLQARDIRQPFKQAHREVYALTPAERETCTYSNRFAAHILRQHQFRALCRARGWRYELQGEWDSHNIPERYLHRHELMVQFFVEALTDADLTEAFIYLYLSSDQVRFCDAAGEPQELTAVPPLVFSEVMRDVDLFVAVTSVANDPNWTDGGPAGNFANYWQTYAFGDLSQTARTRREVLLNIVPKLAIADQLEITDRFLEVTGKMHSYKIHLGSGNIMMMPSNRYLCIVRGAPDKKTSAVRLPFEGDSMLSLILSKAFMLADDDKITDQGILHQLR